MHPVVTFLCIFSLCQISVRADDNTGCLVINTCNELRVALLDNGTVNVCANNNLTPIKCDETGSSLARIYLNNNGGKAQQYSSYELNCVTASDDSSSSSSCVIDFTPTSEYDGTSSYGGFVLQDENELSVNGFEFINYQGKGPMFFNQEGSTLSIMNSVFQDNVYTGTSGKNPFLVYDYDSTPGLVTTRIEGCLFTKNYGVLLGFQAGNAFLLNNIFYENGLPSGSESMFTFTSFIFWKPVVGSQFVVEGNHFNSFQAPSSVSSFFMISAYSKDYTSQELLSGISQGKNCAANNDVGGVDARVGINDCNNGIMASSGFPDIQCMELTSRDCDCYDVDIGPPKPSSSVDGGSDADASAKFPPITDCSLNNCEQKVLEVCGEAMEKYGRLMACVVKAIKREPECQAAIALGNGNGIGHIISDDTMYWRENRINTRRRTRDRRRNLRPQEEEALVDTMTSTTMSNPCGDSAFSSCGGICVTPGTVSGDEWFGCLYTSIYDGTLVECTDGDGTNSTIADDEVLVVVDEAAWDSIGTKCGFYN